MEEEEERLKLLVGRDQRGQKAYLERRKLELRHKKEAKLLEMERESETIRVAKELELLGKQDKEREDKQVKVLFEGVESLVREGAV